MRLLRGPVSRDDAREGAARRPGLHRAAARAGVGAVRHDGRVPAFRQPLRDRLGRVLAREPRLPPARPVSSRGRATTCRTRRAAGTSSGSPRSGPRHPESRRASKKPRSISSAARTTSSSRGATSSTARRAMISSCRPAALTPRGARGVLRVHGALAGRDREARSHTPPMSRCSRTGCDRRARRSSICTSSSSRSTSTARRSTTSCGCSPATAASTSTRSPTSRPRRGSWSRRTRAPSRSRASATATPPSRCTRDRPRTCRRSTPPTRCARCRTSCTRCTPRPACTCPPTRSGTIARPARRGRCRGGSC